jgi:vacuolar-type H+-ATPase subunit H
VHIFPISQGQGMKDKKKLSSEQAMQQVLLAEREAERAIQDCENEARKIIQDAHIRAQAILARADQRITNMEMRHGHKLDRLIKDIEREGAIELRNESGQQIAREILQSVVKELAAELCQAEADTVDNAEAVK